MQENNDIKVYRRRVARFGDADGKLEQRARQDEDRLWGEVTLSGHTLKLLSTKGWFTCANVSLDDYNIKR